MATKAKLTATIINKTLAPYGIGETIEVLTDSIWEDLGHQVDQCISDLGPMANNQVRVEYRDADGDEVDIYDYL